LEESSPVHVKIPKLIAISEEIDKEIGYKKELSESMPEMPAVAVMEENDEGPLAEINISKNDNDEGSLAEIIISNDNPPVLELTWKMTSIKIQQKRKKIF